MMMFKKALLVSLVSAVAFGCSDTAGPTIDSDPLVQIAPNHLQWDKSSGPIAFTATAGTPEGETSLAPQAALMADGEPAAYSVSFWAKRGQNRYVDIDYLENNADGSVTQRPYLHFDVPALALLRRPNGQYFAWGDSVLITMSVDSDDMLVHLEPSGLQFHSFFTAQLKVWYTGAGEDLDGDGVVNNADWNIEQNLLGIWVQQASNDPWTVLSSVRSPDNKWVSSSLEHFSGYAVSW